MHHHSTTKERIIFGYATTFFVFFYQLANIIRIIELLLMRKGLGLLYISSKADA